VSASLRGRAACWTQARAWRQFRALPLPFIKSYMAYRVSRKERRAALGISGMDAALWLENKRRAFLPLCAFCTAPHQPPSVAPRRQPPLTAGVRTFIEERALISATWKTADIWWTGCQDVLADAAGRLRTRLNTLVFY